MQQNSESASIRKKLENEFGQKIDCDNDTDDFQVSFDVKMQRN